MDSVKSWKCRKRDTEVTFQHNPSQRNQLKILKIVMHRRIVMHSISSPSRRAAAAKRNETDSRVSIYSPIRSRDNRRRDWSSPLSDITSSPPPRIMHLSRDHSIDELRA
ncbi:uncharacterized, partial [Tachysurus ichikawai]